MENFEPMFMGLGIALATFAIMSVAVLGGRWVRRLGAGVINLVEAKVGRNQALELQEIFNAAVLAARDAEKSGRIVGKGLQAFIYAAEVGGKWARQNGYIDMTQDDINDHVRAAYQRMAGTFVNELLWPPFDEVEPLTAPLRPLEPAVAAVIEAAAEPDWENDEAANRAALEALLSHGAPMVRRAAAKQLAHLLGHTTGLLADELEAPAVPDIAPLASVVEDEGGWIE